MNMEITEKIQARLTELLDMRQKYVAEAEKNIAAYNAAIGELERLLAPGAAETTETTE
jgi:hypothetical protein